MHPPRPLDYFPMRTLAVALAVSLLACSSAPEEAAEEPPTAKQEFWVFFGTYTGEESQGIYRSRFDASSGALSAPELAAEIENPSYLAIHPNGRFLYSVVETNDGAVTAFAFDEATGALTELNTQPAQGDAPCDLEVDPSGKMLVVANYTSGDTTAYLIADDGTLSEPTAHIVHEGSGPHERQKAPHAHSVDWTADGSHVLVSDLGKDRVIVYEADRETGALTSVSEGVAPAGSGPRHFAFSADEKFGFSLGELASTITTMTFADGKLEPGETVTTLPADFDERTTTAEIMLHPSGQFLYASNRGHDSIAAYSIDPATGALTTIGITSTGGQTPRGFAIDPTGGYLIAANQKSDNVVVFSIDPATGALSPTGDEIALDAGVSVHFHPIPK